MSEKPEMTLDKWQQEVIRMSVEMVEKAQPELIAMVEKAAVRHAPLAINQDAAIHFARILNDVQNESFQLGLRLGMKTIVDVLLKQPKESKAD